MCWGGGTLQGSGQRVPETVGDSQSGLMKSRPDQAGTEDKQESRNQTHRRRPGTPPPPEDERAGRPPSPGNSGGA